MRRLALARRPAAASKTPGGGGGGGCSYKMQGKSQPGKIVATYTTFGQCTTPHSGSVTLTKQ